MAKTEKPTMVAVGHLPKNSVQLELLLDATVKAETEKK